MSAILIVIIGIVVASACLIGAKKMGGSSPVMRTGLYTLFALVLALLLWLTVMVLFVGPAMKR